MEDPLSAPTPAKLNGTNGSQNNGGSTPKVLKKRGRKPGYKLPRPAGWKPPVKYNLHVVLNEAEHQIFRTLAKGKGASDFVRQMLMGIAYANGLVETPERPKAVPMPCAPGVSCINNSGIVS